MQLSNGKNELNYFVRINEVDSLHSLKITINVQKIGEIILKQIQNCESILINTLKRGKYELQKYL